jgi:hypothetical protein
MVAATATAPVPITPAAPGADGWVEALAPGNHAGDEYTAGDLSDMLLNFRLAKRKIDPPIKIGHEDRQPLLAGVPGLNSGVPAVGWVDDMKVEERPDKDGRLRPVLLVKSADVHPHVSRLVRAGAYRKLSPEVYHGMPPGVLDRQAVLAELRRRSKDADAALGAALTTAAKERAAQQARRQRQIDAGTPEGIALKVEDEEDIADRELRKQLGKVLRGIALLGGEMPVIKTLADWPADAFAEGGVRAHRRWLAHHAAWCYSEGGGSMDRAQIEAHLKAAGISDAAVEQLGPLPDENLQAFGMEVLAKLAGTADAAAGGGADATATDAAAAVPDVTAGATPDVETMIADLVALGEDEAALRAMDEASLAALWKEKKGAAMSETATRRPVTAADLAAFERRLKAAQAQQAALLAIQGRRYARERAAEDARLCERWRDDWHDLPREFDENPAAPNFRQNLAAADDTTKRNYGGKLMTQREAMIASMEARGKNYARRNFSEKVKDQHQGSDFADVDASVDAYVKRRHGKRKTA